MHSTPAICSSSMSSLLANTLQTAQASSVLFALRSPLRRILIQALLALLLPPELHAAIPPGYSIQTFQSEQGFPQNNINAIIQSRDGYLWLGTFGGLVRFDGVRFQVFDTANTPQLHNNRITALFEDESGAIWIGHETGDLTRLRAGEFETIALPGPAVRERILAITTDVDARPTVFYEGGTLRGVQTGALITPGAASDPQRGVTACVRDVSGALWILRGGAVSRVAGNRTELIEFDKFAADQLVYGIGAARAGGLWVASRNSIRKRVGEEWTDQLSTAWRPESITALLEMRNGTLAVATMEQGIFLLRKNMFPLRLDRNDGLPPDWVRTLCEDGEGNLWVGLGSGGLVALRPARAAPIQPTDRADRWKGRPVVSVHAASDHKVWIGTEGAGLYRYFYGVCAPFIAEKGPPTNAFVWSMAEDAANRLWISTAESGLHVFDGDRFQTPPGIEDFPTPVRVLFPSPAQNALLMGARSGLFKYANQKLLPLATNLIAPDIRCIAEQTNGVLWFGMFGGGLGRLENGWVTQFRKADGLASDFVQALHLDADNALWIGTAESGLTRYKNGRFSAITTAHGLRNNVICHIADDGLGNFWMSSHAGIMRISKADLNRCADGSTTSVTPASFAETDGLPSAQCSGGLQPTGTRTADGSLLFATVKGIVAIDPAHVRTNHLPIVLIEQLRVNEAPLAAGNSGPISIPPGRQRFDFDYTAINFAAPDRILFKYRLEGLERNWIGPTPKRTVSYSHLAPGNYTFRLIASNSDGAWNESPATLAFTVLPFFWQTIWFRALVIFVSLAIVGLAALLVTRARYRRQLELAERQRGIERERSRIAQDIHDDLGSSLTRIILLSQSARGDLDSPEDAAHDLDRIYDTARNLTRSLDEIVWAVNPRHDTLDSLATYLGKFAQDFLGAANIRCRLDLPVTLPAWPLSAEARHNVFLAFKEALNNTVKHAQATQVRIALALEPTAFTLTVDDNGRGFTASAPHEATSTEDGLANICKRLSDINGSCKIESEPGKGTRISFHVPVARE